MKDIDIKKVRNNLRAKRIANGMSQDDVAEALGVSKKTISNYECHPETLDIAKLNKLGRLYGCHPTEFFCGC